MTSIDILVLLLPVGPLVSAGTTALLSPIVGQRVVRVATTLGAATLILAVFLLWGEISRPDGSPAVHATSWGSLLLDPLGLLMAVLIAFISLLVRVYSVRYMVEEAGYVRFFVLLDLMVATLLTMVTAGDLITLIVAWHLVGLLLYLLLGHDLQSRSAHRYGFRTFITYRFGDLPLVLAAIILYRTYDTWSLPEIFRLIQADPNLQTSAGLPVTEVVSGLVALAAFARSAQFLLHTWLPYTMDGPTPVSALMHAGVVNAGGFLINRFAPVFVHTDSVLYWVFLVGLVTALAGSVLMLSQSDTKKTLGYSTMGQMGFMTMECGVGAFSLAIFHLIAHGLFKGTMFLNSGAVIGQARRHDAVPKDEMYTFVIEKQPQVRRSPFVVMFVTTTLVPLIVLGLAHLVIASEVFQEQGAIILLFFGWVTGAQLLFAAYRMPTRSTWRLVGIIVLSFTVVVIGYTAVTHAFAQFLYPDGGVAALYAAAHIDPATAGVLAVLVVVVALGGWASAHYASRRVDVEEGVLTRLQRSFYASLSRELYVADVYAAVNRGLLAASSKVNTWMRWG